jgi:hypothetical protein
MPHRKRTARWRRAIEAEAVDKGVEAMAVDANLGRRSHASASSGH